MVRFQEGESPGIFWGYIADGIFQNQSDVDINATQPNAQPGDIRFVDVNGDGVVNADDRTKLEILLLISESVGISTWRL